MKKYTKLFLLCCFCFYSFMLNAAIFETGKEKTISNPVYGNLYLAAETVHIDAPINGDLMVAAGIISINDTVFEDLYAAGSDILINNYLADDAVILGENITILKSVNGDLIVCGASIQIHKDVVISGDLIILGAFAKISGTVLGKVKVIGSEVLFNGIANKSLEIRADEVTIDGIVVGHSTLAANEIQLKSNAQFQDSIDYWQKEGELSFEKYAANEVIKYNPDLEFYESDEDWKFLGFGVFGLWLMFILSVILSIVILVFVFNKLFVKAGETMSGSIIRNFGFGALYFIATPLLCLFFFATIIGIPIGFVLLHLYLFSILFAFPITSIILSETINTRRNKGWGKWNIIGIAILIFAAIQIISFIPFIGVLVTMVAVGIAYGAVLATYLKAR